MDITIFTNIDVKSTHWYGMFDESYNVEVLPSQEPKWTIEAPIKELRKLTLLLAESNLESIPTRGDSITIFACVVKNPQISIRSANPFFVKEIQAEMLDLAFEVHTRTVSKRRAEKRELQYGGGVDINLVNTILSRLKCKFDIEITSNNEWPSQSDTDCRVHIPLPENFNPLDQIDLKFKIYTDSEDLTLEIAGQGIEGLEIESVSTTNLPIWEGVQQFELQGPLGMKDDEKMIPLIAAINKYMYETLDVSKQSHCLDFVESKDLEILKLFFPIKQYREQLLPANVGENNNRFMLHIQSDSEEEMERLNSHFLELGYLVKGEVTDGIHIRQYQSYRGDAVSDSLGQFEELLTTAGTAQDLVLVENDNLNSSAIRIIYPTKMIQKSQNVSGITNFNVRYFDKGTKEKLRSKVKAIGYTKLSIDDDDELSNEEMKIIYGGFDLEKLILLESIMKNIFDIPANEITKFQMRWPDYDMDVTVEIPEKYKMSVSSHELESINQWLEIEQTETLSPFIQIEAGDFVRIGETSLNMYDNPAVQISPPSADLFRLYCLDQSTANTLNIVASNVVSGEPCLLEGETATSKTSIILFLAHLIKQPVKRINLNGQTDTGELIGRYVPNDAEDSNVQWVWENGDIINAMKHGWWVILDEVNLAEPQILERINSLLENPPSLSATEKSPPIEFGGSSGELVHPSFRIFATMNPAEYSGRVAMSPAYKDRWTGYSYVPLAKEIDILHMLNMWVFGETPQVNVDGIQYEGREVNIPLANLHELSKSLDVQDFIVRIARSHYTLSRLASTDNSKGISMSRKERPVFSRRLLTRFMTYLDEQICPDSDVGEICRVVRLGLVRYYIRRVHSEEDLAIISETLDGQGIGPNVWNLWAE